MPEPLDVDVSFSARVWLESLPEVENRCHQAAQAAFAVAGPSRRGGVEVSIVLADDEQGRRLNRDYRGKDRPTNVLSFANMDPGGDGPGPLLLGDIVISYGVALAEAGAEGNGLADHLSHLVVHGVLHLLGYDHLQDDAAEEMEALERRILERLGISDPYAGEALDGGPLNGAVAS